MELPKLFDELGKVIPKDSSTFRTYLNLNRRYRSNNQNKVRGIISSEEYNLELNKLIEGAITLVNELETVGIKKETDFQIPIQGGPVPELFRLFNKQHRQITSLTDKIKIRNLVITFLAVITIILLGSLGFAIKPSLLVNDQDFDKESFKTSFTSQLKEGFKEAGLEVDIFDQMGLYISGYHPFTQEQIETEISRIDIDTILKKKIFSERPFVVYALDSREYDALVYDHSRRIFNGTNAQEIQSILAKQPSMVVKDQLVYPTWSNERDIAEEKPDLIIIHYSAFERNSKDNAINILKKKINFYT